ncbi:MAG: DUF6036 family nucleotidyltransferase [Candidatus Muiribacteriota bacterium]
MFYLEILKELYENKIKYLIVGGLAVNLHNVPRMTNDIDIIISTDKKNVDTLCDLLEEMNFIPRIPVNPKDISNSKTITEWKELRNLKALSFFNKKFSYKEIDILLIHPLNFDVAYKKKDVRIINKIPVNLVNIDDLIIMKEYSGRKQDINDIKLLKQIKDIKNG